MHSAATTAFNNGTATAEQEQLLEDAGREFFRIPEADHPIPMEKGRQVRGTLQGKGSEEPWSFRCRERPALVFFKAYRILTPQKRVRGIMPVEVRGVAHPPPTRGGREDPSDLSAAEIATTNLGGAPLFWEHQTSSKPVGQVLASWEGADGSLRMSATVTDPAIEKRVRNGTARGLSLGTDVISTDTGDVLMRSQRELSVCQEGRRAGTWIDTIDSKRVLRRAKASRGAHDLYHPRPPD